MDNISQLTMFANTDVLKEPRGFIKFLQIILAIFAFATATAFYSSTEYSVKCFNQTELSVNTIQFGYPFRLSDAEIKVNACGHAESVPIYGDYTAASQFYVFVGVTAFLYSLGILIFYVFGDDKYHNIETIPIVDFVVTAVYAALWLISSSAFADAVTHIKHYTDPTDYWSNEKYACECVNPPMPGCKNTPAEHCSVTGAGNYASINVSIIFGFLCMCVWAGNLWFLYKETKWHKSANMPPPMPQQSMPGQQDMSQQKI